MTILAIGLLLFLGIHLLPVAPPLRRALQASWGEGRYKALFSIVSAVGLVLIVVGYALSGPRAPLFAPRPEAIAIAPYAMVVSFILFAAANMKTHLRRALRHPMLLGTLIWSGVHFLANGDRAGSLLFGAFFAWALIDLASAIGRKAVASFEPEARFDVMAIGGGVVVALAVMFLHRVLFGVPVVAFGL
jgi:uncharacterized membrane protein